jgi:hypothetical protein
MIKISLCFYAEAVFENEPLTPSPKGHKNEPITPSPGVKIFKLCLNLISKTKYALAVYIFLRMVLCTCKTEIRREKNNGKENDLLPALEQSPWDE